MSIKSTITRNFKLNGLSIRVDAAKALASALSREEDVQAALRVVSRLALVDLDGEAVSGSKPLYAVNNAL